MFLTLIIVLLFLFLYEPQSNVGEGEEQEGKTAQSYLIIPQPLGFITLTGENLRTRD